MTETACFDALLAELTSACYHPASANHPNAAERAIYLIGILGDYYNDAGDQMMAHACHWCFQNGKRPLDTGGQFIWGNNHDSDWPYSLDSNIFNALPRTGFSTVTEAIEALAKVLKKEEK